MHDDGEGELSDATSVLDWLQQYNTNSKIVWVAGFSFGAWVAMQLLMRRPEINNFISVSPPANTRDFGFLAPCPSSGLIIHGDKDSVMNPKYFFEACEILQNQGFLFESHLLKGEEHTVSPEILKLTQNFIKKNI